MAVSGVARFFQGLTPLHLLHQKVRIHGYVRFFPYVITVDFAQIDGASEWIAKGLVGVIGRRRPLHGSPFFRFGCRHETVRMYQMLYFAVSLIEHGAIDGELYRQTEKFEMVLHDEDDRFKP